MNQKNLTNDLGQSIGEPVENWKIRAVPPKTKMEGKYCCWYDKLFAYS